MEQLINLSILILILGAGTIAGEFPPKNRGPIATLIATMLGFSFVIGGGYSLAVSGTSDIEDALLLKEFSLDTMLILVGYLFIILGLASRFGRKVEQRENQDAAR